MGANWPRIPRAGGTPEPCSSAPSRSRSAGVRGSRVRVPAPSRSWAPRRDKRAKSPSRATPFNSPVEARSASIRKKGLRFPLIWVPVSPPRPAWCAETSTYRQAICCCSKARAESRRAWVPGSAAASRSGPRRLRPPAWCSARAARSSPRHGAARLPPLPPSRNLPIPAAPWKPGEATSRSTRSRFSPARSARSTRMGPPRAARAAW